MVYVGRWGMVLASIRVWSDKWQPDSSNHKVVSLIANINPEL